MTVQNPSDFDMETGLEDFNASDAVIPRLTIVHKEGLLKDSLSGETFQKVDAILLGLVKQRILWHPDIGDDKDAPMCKSPNHKEGIPNDSEDQPKAKRFPWDKSGFRPEDFPPNENGLVILGCDGCQLKDWGSHPDGKKPYCAEQFTLPILYVPSTGGGIEEDWTKYVPAIMSVQKTSLKPLKSYLTSFSRARGAAFQAVTQIGLDLTSRGTTDYSIATFRKIGETNDDNWREYSTAYRQMRDFLEALPDSPDDDGEVPASMSPNVNKPPAEKKAEPAPVVETPPVEDIVDAETVEEEPPAAPPVEEAKVAAPVAAVAPPAPADDDDLPF